MSDSPYTDLDRPPLREGALNKALVRPGGLWRKITVVRATGSTNADLAAEARDGAGEGTILIAEQQVAGKGRLGRMWSAPPRSGLAVSLLLRPAVPASARVWLPLLTGVAVVTALRRVAEADARLKWPNDVLIGERKLAGILAEAVGDAVIVGVGLNVSLTVAELPVPTATSLAIEDLPADRDPLLRAILREQAVRYRGWTASGGDPEPIRAEYRTMCATLGRVVRVELPSGAEVTGTAEDIDHWGRLMVRSGTEEYALSAGDVVHVR